MINSLNSAIPQEFVYPVGEAPAQKMPREVLVNVIGAVLSLPGFAALARVCTMWQTMIQSNIEEKLLEEVSFGDKWMSIPGVRNVSEGYALTEAQKKWVIGKLKTRCVFFNVPDLVQAHRFQNDKIKRMWQTHKLIFFPKTVNGEPRTINSQNRLFHFIKEVDDGTAFYLIGENENAAFRNRPATRSYWGLVTLDVVPGSRGTEYTTKESLLQPKGYRVLTPNEATTSILIMNLGASKEKKGYFFGSDWPYRTYTTTTELYLGSRLVVGAASSSGPMAYTRADSYTDVGAAVIAEVPYVIGQRNIGN